MAKRKRAARRTTRRAAPRFKAYKAPRGKAVRGTGRSGQTVRIVIEGAPHAPRLGVPAMGYAPTDGVLMGPSDPRPKRSRF